MMPVENYITLPVDVDGMTPEKGLIGQGKNCALEIMWIRLLVWVQFRYID